jgi:uncharacterized protein DUF4339
MSDPWYYAEDGKTVGPITLTDLMLVLSRTPNSNNVYVWTEGFEDWEKAENVKELASIMDKGPPPPRQLAMRPLVAHEPIFGPLPSTNKITQSIDSKIAAESFIAPTLTASNSNKTRWNNLIAMNWRGEFPLWVSYWIFGFLGTFLAALAGLGIISVFQSGAGYHPLKVLGVIGATWISIAAIVIWQLVGIWRSSGRYIDQKTRAGKSGFWGGLARFAVVIGIARSLVTFAQAGLPQIAEAWSVAFLGDPGIPNYSLRIMRNGTEIEISGGFKYGLNNDFARLLDASPQMKVVHLNSIGGRLGEAEALFNTIKSRKLITYTSEQCASACTLAFLAGRERWISESGKLGFHGPTFPGLTEPELRELAADWKLQMLSVGVSPDFVARALSTPNTSMWQPDPGELLKAHVITGVANRDQFAMSGLGSKSTRDDLYQEFLKVPLYVALEKKEPRAYAALVDEFYDRYISGEPEGKLIEAMQAKLIPIINSYLPLADDASLLDYARIFAAQLRAVASIDKRTCFQIARGNTLPNISAFVPKPLLDQELVLYDRILRTASVRPKTDDDTLEAIRQALMARLENRVGNKVSLLSLENFTAQQQADYCDLAIAMFEEIAKFEPRQAANWMRYTFAK